MLSKLVSFSVAVSEFIGKVLVTHYGNTNINNLALLVLCYFRCLERAKNKLGCNFKGE